MAVRDLAAALAAVALGCARPGDDSDTSSTGDTDPVVDEAEAGLCENGIDDGGDGLVDCADPACAEDSACAEAFACAPTDEVPAGWVIAAGYRARVVADAADGLLEPVGVTFAGGPFENRLYVSDAGASALLAVDVGTGATTPFVAATAWPDGPPAILTAVAWDKVGAFDGNLYVADSVTDGDQDTVIYRIAPTGAATVFTEAPGPGLDSVYAMAFAPADAIVPGLFVAGDTDGALVDWGVFDATGAGAPFSEVAGVEGIAFDLTGTFGDGPIAARPNGGGYAGDGTITPLDLDGEPLTPIATGLPGVHAVVVGPAGGPFAGDLFAADWSTDRIVRVTPAGVVTAVAEGLALTNYDANILTISPDGAVLVVADRLASRVVCLELSP